MTAGRGRVLVGAGVVAAVMLTGACGSSASTAGSTSGSATLTAIPPSVDPTTSVSTATVTTAPAAPSTDAPRSSSVSNSPAERGNCTNDQLSVRAKDAEGGDSHGGIIVVFTNRSSTTCSLYGYPGAAAVDTAGKQVDQAKRTLEGFIGGCGCAGLSPVSLRAGGSASSVIEGDNGGGDECLGGHAVLVTAPNTTRSVHLRYLDAYTCHFQVHPVVAGTSGGNHH